MFFLLKVSLFGNPSSENVKMEIEMSSRGVEKQIKKLLTSSSCHPKILVKEFSYFLMPCHQHGLGVNLLVQR